MSLPGIEYYAGRQKDVQKGIKLFIKLLPE
jgi:hypothetical protein